MNALQLSDLGCSLLRRVQFQVQPLGAETSQGAHVGYYTSTPSSAGLTTVATDRNREGHYVRLGRPSSL